MIAGADERLAATLGREALERLHASTAAIVGVGLLGGRISQDLALLGVGQILVDPGRVEPANLGNQALPAAALGEPKVAARARQIELLAPDCRVEAIAARVEALGLARLAGVDLLVAGLDSRASRVRVNDISLRLAIPWVDCAVDGSGRELLGSVALYDPRVPDSPCYLCRLDGAALAALAREGRGSGCPSWRDPAAPLTVPTLASPAFGGAVAGFAALWCLDVLLGRAGAVAGRELLVGVRPPRLASVALARSPRCCHDHGRLDPLRPSLEPTLPALYERATADLGRPPDALALHHHALVRGLRCPACGATRALARLSHAYSDADVRCGCGSEMAPASMADRMGPDELAELADLSFADLGFPESDVVSAVSGDGVAHYAVNLARRGAERCSEERAAAREAAA